MSAFTDIARRRGATVHDVTAEVDRIIAAGDVDPEVSHCDEYDLRLFVLRMVVADHPEASAMARECLRLAEAPLTRWYA